MKPLIIANWKCNPNTFQEAKKLFQVIPKKKEVIICPPSVYFPWGKKVNLGSQDCFYQSGSFTGEISPAMLKSLKINYVILGHSERRNYFQESDKLISKKIEACLEAGLKVILCVGEKKGQNTKSILRKQLASYRPGVFALAYEPVWAIGTGNSCDPVQAEKALSFIKEKTDSHFLYGGSVKSHNFKDYLNIGFDGVLVGGASLNIKEFKKML